MRQSVSKAWLAGVIGLAWGSGLAVAQDGDAEVDPDAQSVLSEQAAAADDPDVFDPTRPSSWTQGWSGGVELGLNGSEGNTEQLNLRAGLNATRETDFNLTTGSLTYSYATEDGDATQNRARGDLRNDYKFQDSPWTLFAQGSIEYDEFQEWDMRISAFAGVGYRLIDNEKTNLLLRAGAGAQREIGGSENAIQPEALLGADFSTQLTAKQKLTASVDVFPDLGDFGEGRVIAKAAWEVLLDEESNLSLKIGIEDRYDTQPGAGFKRNDIDYFAVLVFAF